RLSRTRSDVARQARGDAGDDGPSLPPFRSSESVRPARVLHPACLGLEGQPARGIRKLASARLLRFVRGPKPLISVDCQKEGEPNKCATTSIRNVTSRERAASSPVSLSPAPWAQPMARPSRPPLRRPSSRRRTATLFSWSLQLRARKGTSACPP